MKHEASKQTETLNLPIAQTRLTQPAQLTQPALRELDALPGPRGIPMLGNALQIESTRFHQQLEAWCDEFGPLFKLQIGKRKILVVGDHQMVALILRDRPDGMRRSARFAEIWREMNLPTGLFGSNGETWQRQRRMVMASFDPAHVKRYFPALQTVAQRLIGRWKAAARASTWRSPWHRSGYG